MMKYVVIDDHFQAYTPSKYPDMFNITSVVHAYVYDNESDATKRANYLNSGGYHFFVSEYSSALKSYIDKQLDIGMNIKVCEDNEYYIPNLFKNIRAAIDKLEALADGEEEYG